MPEGDLQSAGKVTRECKHTWIPTILDLILGLEAGFHEKFSWFSSTSSSFSSSVVTILYRQMVHSSYILSDLQSSILPFSAVTS
jgi:hypothetical protein